MDTRSTPAHTDVISRVVVRNIAKRLHALGWGATYLAKRVGCERTGLQHMLKNRRRMPLGLMQAIGHEVGLTIDEMAETMPPKEVHEEWNPWYHDCQTKLARFAEHERDAKNFDTYDILPAYSRMTLEVQGAVNQSRFGKVASAKNGERLIENYKVWGERRLQAYLARGKEGGPTITTVMRRSQFERLIHLREPFDLCSVQQAVECLEHLRLRCVQERGFRLLLLDDKKLQRHPDLEMQLNAVEALGVVGKNFMFTKSHDAKVQWSEKQDAVKHARQLLKRVRRLADHTVDPDSILGELAEYQRQLDRMFKDTTRVVLSPHSNLRKIVRRIRRRPK